MKQQNYHHHQSPLTTSPTTDNHNNLHQHCILCNCCYNQPFTNHQYNAFIITPFRIKSPDPPHGSPKHGWSILYYFFRKSNTAEAIEPSLSLLIRLAWSIHLLDLIRFIAVDSVRFDSIRLDSIHCFTTTTAHLNSSLDLNLIQSHHPQLHLQLNHSAQSNGRSGRASVFPIGTHCQQSRIRCFESGRSR